MLAFRFIGRLCDSVDCRDSLFMTALVLAVVAPLSPCASSSFKRSDGVGRVARGALPKYTSESVEGHVDAAALKDGRVGSSMGCCARLLDALESC